MSYTIIILIRHSGVEVLINVNTIIVKGAYSSDKLEFTYNYH